VAVEVGQDLTGETVGRGGHVPGEIGKRENLVDLGEGIDSAAGASELLS
jgi:hypothetical protein